MVINFDLRNLCYLNAKLGSTRGNISFPYFRHLASSKFRFLNQSRLFVCSLLDNRALNPYSTDPGKNFMFSSISSIEFWTVGFIESDYIAHKYVNLQPGLIEL